LCNVNTTVTYNDIGGAKEQLQKIREVVEVGVITLGAVLIMMI
jgi:ATP-dependent 26S proteasome regulatory subunit